MALKTRERLAVPLQLAPALGVIILLFMGGLAMGLLQSFGYIPVLQQYELSFDSYKSVFQDKAFWGSFRLSIWLGIASTILSTILAIFYVLLLRESTWGKRLFSIILQLNIPIPHIIGAISILFLFSQSGLISRLFYQIGLTTRPADFPALIFDKFGIGILIEYLWKETAFTGIILLSILQSLDNDYENLAQVLGANRWQRFWFVTVPLITPGILRASILVFAFSFGNYEVPFLLGAKYPEGLPVLAYEYYTDVDLGKRSEAMAISMVISLVSMILIFLYMRLTRKLVREV